MYINTNIQLSIRYASNVQNHFGQLEGLSRYAQKNVKKREDRNKDYRLLKYANHARLNSDRLIIWESDFVHINARLRHKPRAEKLSERLLKKRDPLKVYSGIIFRLGISAVLPHVKIAEILPNVSKVPTSTMMNPCVCDGYVVRVMSNGIRPSLSSQHTEYQFKYTGKKAELINGSAEISA